MIKPTDDRIKDEDEGLQTPHLGLVEPAAAIGDRDHAVDVEEEHAQRHMGQSGGARQTDGVTLKSDRVLPAPLPRPATP